MSDSEITCPVHAYLYICPTDGCGNHYASKHFQPGDTTLQTLQTRRTAKGETVETFARLECPDCRVNGIRVDRVPFLVTRVIKLEDILEN